MWTQYPFILPHPSLILFEKTSAYPYFSERHMQALWFEQKYFKNLKTHDGQSIIIISPGIWNAEAGPDFKKAHLKIEGKEYFGDIELHLSQEGWVQHHHHQDPRYNDVVLHLSLWQPRIPKNALTAEGKTCFSASLENYLTIPPQRILQLIDLDLYPYKKFLGSGRCAKELFQTLKEAEIRSFFREAALWRLQKKYEYLGERTSLRAALGIAAALGYKNNTEQFMDLFLWLREEHRDQPPDILMALALGVCGFFENHFKNKWQQSNYYQTLQLLWGEWLTKACHQTKLELNQVRPLNHPVRRVAYLVKLLGHNIEDLEDQLLQIWESNWPKCSTRTGCKDLLEKLLELIPHYDDEYWNWHYTFEEEKQSKYLPLLGNDLKRKILTNTFLPIFWVESLKEEQRHALVALFHFLPHENTGKSKYLTHRFFGETPKGKLLKTADMEQGAYQLHKDFCIHYEASCEGCPFVENYKNIKDNS